MGRLGLALLLLLAFVVSSYLAFSYWVRRGVTAVPEVRGLDEAEARATLAKAGLAVRAADAARWSADVPAGRALETRPGSGAFVKRGAEVEVVLSRGAHRLRVPDLTGKALTAAHLTLEGEGLVAGPTLEVFAARGPAGTVVGQDPAPGTELADGAAVTLLVARESTARAWVMPDLVSRRYEPVRAALEGSGFRFGGVTLEPYEGVAAGTILRQTPPPGHPLRRTDSIALVVAGTREELSR